MPEPTYNAPALELGIHLISYLAGCAEPKPLADIARAIGSNKNMATRLLSTLQRAGWVEVVQPGPRYQLTLSPFRITSQVLARRSVRDVARPVLQALWESTGQSVYLAVLHQDQALYLEHFDGTGPVRVAGRVGGLYPLHCGAPGKVLLSGLSAAKRKAIYRQAPVAYTERTMTTARALEAEVARIHADGYALDPEEFARGILCAAAPVMDHTGAVAAAIGVSVTTLEYDMPRVIAELLPRICEAARQISATCGAGAPAVSDGTGDAS